jgi:hypothetical protein
VEKVDVKARIYRMQGRSETFIHKFSRKVWREETTAEIKGNVGGYY